MQIYTSYFYKVRFMKPYMIPLSTAKYAPKWFHQDKGPNFQWKDKNGVWNGLRAPVFAPGPSCDNLCQGADNCGRSPDSCLFLKTYRYQLDQLDYQDIIKRCESIANQIKKVEEFEEEPIIMLLVHEAPTNPCSERKSIQDWFMAHGKEVKEWNN